jgi:rfaE bifunctional protein kinase chain/domain
VTAPSRMPSRKRLLQLVRQMRGRRLGVIGDWMLDRYLWGTANRISPEAAVPVVEFEKQNDRLGGAGNVAANLAALGARVEAFGIIGADEAGESLRRECQHLKFGVKGILQLKGRPTTVKTRVMARHQQIVRIDRETRMSLPEKRQAELSNRILSALPKMRAVIISDYEKGVVSDQLAETIVGACAKRRIPLFTGPKRMGRISRPPAYRGATLVICNRIETELLVNRALDSEQAVRSAGPALLEHFGSSAVVITRGAEGLNLFERDDANGFHVPAMSQEAPLGALGKTQHDTNTGRQVFDVTGAGDTVLAIMALAFAAGASLREAAVLGNAAAGVVVSKLGTATLTSDELSAILREVPA